MNCPLPFLLLALSPRLSISLGSPASSKLGAIPTLTQALPRRRAGTGGDSSEAAPSLLSRAVAVWQTAVRVRRRL